MLQDERRVPHPPGGHATCGGYLYADHPPLELTDVFAAMLPSLEFEPAVHVRGCVDA